ncbi:cold shock domain-containing protein [Variovorax dokdonensis]|uniref:Cold shock domain-containing protein n=1 Tax=Variovorax dokdonensis TaxID=344883 RepID=A0ABT7N4R0_9BURK|nr:cold shock domain-containing protein [Variovorax dokdonensis]MDM0042926.1 cold shock domain-containing protein [Variovorax dokdonensis]
MAHSGKLRTWHDDRGFGFIAPRDGGRELFVHISAFPRDGSRPTEGETLIYELGVGRDGKPQAVRVYRQAIGAPASRSSAGRPVHEAPGSSRAPLLALIVLALVCVAGFVGWRMWEVNHPRAVAEALAGDSIQASALPTTSSFRCDGRTYCSQMTSCAEAKYFLKNCPDTKMDGNHDGVPCEQQWCTSFFAQ